MDNGSQRTYVTERVVKELNLPTYDTEKLRIIAFGNKNQSKRLTELKRVQLSLMSQYNSVQSKVIATVVPSICEDLLPTPTVDNTELNNVRMELADYKSCNERLISGINLLIGQDYYWKYNTSESKSVADNLVAVKTFFGWTVQGQHKGNKGAAYVFQVREEDTADFDISQFWNLESIGIANVINYDEKLAIENTLANITIDDGRYVVKLPLIIDCATLNNNKQVALSRLYGLTYKLRKNSEKFAEYDNAIRDLIHNNIVEKAPETAVGNPVYYMPHRPVYREHKTTTKMRIVFDASSSEPGYTSLNEHLSAGENLVADLLSVSVIRIDFCGISPCLIHKMSSQK
ncbi:uncharacterized protein [Eurosta solidaginis]|uniref:uncharacterized protein n=1 Tax=Eurosta solidaginis TaxID=178769 RepID=UPI0035316CD3